MTDERILRNAGGETVRINLASPGRYAVALSGRILQAATVEELHILAAPLGWTPIPETNARTFTPRHAVTDERLQLELSETDDPIPGRGKWVRLICDSRGQRWLAWGAPCSLNCHCDAVAIEARDLDTLSANQAGDFNEAMEAIRNG